MKGVTGLIRGASDEQTPDDELVRRFAAGDAQAFAALVGRHGAAVWAVSRRVARDHHAAEDTFQATFLLLARKAASLRSPGSVGSWLHGVAVRVATRARAARKPAPLAADPPAPPDTSLAEAERVLHEELAALPERYRAPLVLCCLEGLSRDEAARRLGWSFNRLKHGLERGRDLLRARLVCRGVGLGTGLLAALLAPPAMAVPSDLHESATRLAGAGVPPPGAVALANGVQRSMTLSQLKWAALAGAVAVLSVVGAALALAPAPRVVQTKSVPVEVPAKTAPKPAQPKAAWDVGTEFLQHLIDGKPDLARKLADPRAITERHVKELQVAGLKRVKVAMILLSDTKVVVVTERAKLTRRPGAEPTDEHATVTLERAAPDAAWLVRDVDIASAPTVARESKQYLEGKFKFEKGEKPAMKQELPNPAASVAAEFYALALAEKTADALALTVPGSISENKVGELRKTDAKAAKVVMVLINDTRVEAVFERQKLNFSRDETGDGHIVLMATKSGDKWLVKDIDGRDEDRVKDRIDLYLAGRYDAKK